MDISETYIKMCEQAKKIQDLREIGKPFADGDWWISRRWKDAVPCSWRAYRGMEDVWLPRQDQLQEMVQEDAITQIQRLWGWIITSHYTPIGLPQPSMEQLWLAFVMENKYGKAWNGSSWETLEVGGNGKTIFTRKNE